MIDGSCHCGAVTCKFNATPESATARHCTVCRCYGVLWADDFEGEGVSAWGTTTACVWGGKSLGLTLVLPVVACSIGAPCNRAKTAVAASRSTRLTAPEPIAHLSIDHFDGLVNFVDLPRDGRCVADLWF